MKDHFFGNFEKNTEKDLYHCHDELSQRASTIVQQTSREIGSTFEAFNFAERKSRERITFDEFSSVKILDFSIWNNWLLVVMDDGYLKMIQLDFQEELVKQDFSLSSRVQAKVNNKYAPSGDLRGRHKYQFLINEGRVCSAFLIYRPAYDETLQQSGPCRIHRGYRQKLHLQQKAKPAGIFGLHEPE